MKTLVIDTEEQIMAMIRAIFCKKGGCEWADDGEKGLRYIKKAFEEGEPYELIILDIVLPELDGHAIIKQIRRLELKYGIKPLNEARIIVLTRRSDEPTLLNAFRNGATGWIAKPIDITALERKIHNLGLN